MCIYVYICIYIYIYMCIYIWLFMDFISPWDTKSENLWHPVASFGRGSDPLYIKCWTSRPRSGGLEARMLDAGGRVAARWEQGIERNSHTLDAPGVRRILYT